MGDRQGGPSLNKSRHRKNLLSLQFNIESIVRTFKINQK